MKRSRVLPLVLVPCLAVLVARAGLAETASEEQPTVLEPIVVTATRSSESLQDAPASISVVERSEIQEARPTVGLAETLNRVPGVLVEDSGNFAQDERIQIRGFGTRAAFGIREIRVLVDGLPETLPDGQTELDAIDLGMVDHIEVLRGPASSLYGNASGGVIQLFTEDGPPTPEVDVRALAGSYGLTKEQVKGGGQLGPLNLLVQSSYFNLDGYRQQSRARSTTANAKLRYDLDEATRVTLLVNGVDAPVADDAGGLTRAEVEEDPRQARSLNRQQRAGEAVKQTRAGVVLQRKDTHGELSAYAYALYREFDNRLPIPPATPPLQGGVVSFYRFSPGLGVRYVLDAELAGFRDQLTAGVDVQHQDDNRRRFANENGARGALGLHQDERVTSVGPYVRDAFSLRDDLELSFGLRYDAVHFATDVHFPPDSPGGGAMTFDAVSPAGSIRYSPRRWFTTFFDVGTAFQVPTTTELANPAGAGFNPDLKPQSATEYEIGARVDWPWLHAEAAGFLIDLEDELVPFELPTQPGRTFFRNAGRSLRYGLELGWDATPIPGLTWTSSLTLLHARYRDYQTPDGTFDGNREPGIPPWQLYEELAYRHPSGLFAAFEAFVVGHYDVDDANSTRTRSYALCNLRAGYTFGYGAFEVEPFVGLLNLADTNYDARVRLNADAMRFFEPGAGFNAYGGVTVSMRL